MVYRHSKQVLFLGFLLFSQLLPIFCFGQSVENSIKKSLDYYNKGNYPKCLTEAQEAVSLAEKKAGQDPLTYYKALQNLAGAYSANKLQQKTELTLTQLANHSNQKFGPQDETSVLYFEFLYTFYETNYPPAKKILLRQNC